MLTPDDVRNLDLGFLELTAGAWETLARQAQAHSDEYTARVIRPLDGNWTGKDADAALTMLRFFAADLQGIRAEAAGGATILREAHAQLLQAKNDMAAAFDEAYRDGLTIGSDGAVHWGESSTEQSAAHKESLAKPLAARVADARARAEEADFAATAALRGNTDAGPAQDFNTHALGADPVGDSIRLADLVAKMHNGGLSPEEAEQFRILLAQNQADPVFAADFTKRIGPDGLVNATLDLATWSKKYSDDHGGKDPRIADFARIQQQLGVTLATASPVLARDPQWMAALTKAAEEEHKFPVTTGRVTNTTTLYGYQMLGVLMQNGQYDPEFMKTVTNNMLAFERKDGQPPVWTNSTDPPPQFTLNVTGTRGTGLDPVTGMMTALSRNPQAATDFFNQDGGATVDYLLKGREAYPEAYPSLGKPGLEAVGQALTAATTGPVTTEPMKQVLQRTLTDLGSPGGPGVDPELRTSVTQILAGNAATLHTSVTQPGSSPIAEAAVPENAVRIKSEAMLKILGDIGQGPDAAAHIEQLRMTEQTYSWLRLDQTDDHTASAANVKQLEGIAHQSGQVFGALDSAVNQGVKDHQEATDKARNDAWAGYANEINNGAWAAAGMASAAGTPAGVIGSVTAAGINYWVSDYVSAHQQDTSAAARQQIGSNFGEDLTRAQDSADHWLLNRNAQPGSTAIDPKLFQPNMFDAYTAGQNAEATANGKLPR